MKTAADAAQSNVGSKRFSIASGNLSADQLAIMKVRLCHIWDISDALCHFCRLCYYYLWWYDTLDLKVLWCGIIPVLLLPKNLRQRLYFFQSVVR